MSGVLPLLLGTQALHLREMVRVTQGYAVTPAPAWRRTQSGRLVARSHWRSLTTTVTGDSWVPPALLDLDTSAPLSLGCVAPLGARVDASARVGALLFPSREDRDAPVWAHAVVDGAHVPATLTRTGRAVTVNEVAGATSYRVHWFPVLEVLAAVSTQTHAREAGNTQWTLEAELVDGATQPRLAAIATAAAVAGIAGGAAQAAAAEGIRAAFEALAATPALTAREQQVVVSTAVAAATTGGLDGAGADAAASAIATAVDGAAAGADVADVAANAGAAHAGTTAATLRTSAEAATEAGRSGFDTLATDAASATTGTDTGTGTPSTLNALPIAGLAAGISSVAIPATVVIADTVGPADGTMPLAIGGTLSVPAGETWTLVMRWVEFRNVLELPGAQAEPGYEIVADNATGPGLSSIGGTLIATSTPVTAVGTGTGGTVAVDPESWDGNASGDAQVLWEVRSRVPAGEYSNFRIAERDVPVENDRIVALFVLDGDELVAP